MFFERDAVPLCLHLLEPCQAKLMRGEACDYVVVAIAVHVVRKHLRAAARGERKLARLPRLLARRRLLKPAVLV